MSYNVCVSYTSPVNSQSNANKQAKTQRDAGQITEGQTEVDGSSQDEAWYPKEKVNYAKKKLQGANSSDITK